ncbi:MULTISPECIES: hypothetical protein [unclassified Pseudonocardia]|uniref:hypothetical protein n=1 Tax=unclassified Pseudonocardia TaxID=2619320 RepID=UPI00030CACE7|nr:hypothetical protein [Pseudonocardia sp. Ae707_Ps1]
MLAIAVAGQAMLALALLGVGLWGRSRAGALPTSSLGEEERRRRATVMIRGAWVSIGLGTMFAVSALLALL